MELSNQRLIALFALSVEELNGTSAWAAGSTIRGVDLRESNAAIAADVAARNGADVVEAAPAAAAPGAPVGVGGARAR